MARVTGAWIFGGKRGTLAFGVYPIVSLAEARDQRDAAKKQIATGIDPALDRKLKKLATIAAAGNNFKAVADEWVEKLIRENRADATVKKTRWLLRFANKAFSNRPISQITAPELLAVLRLIEQRGRYESAQRLRSTCGQIFRYAIATGRAERDPTSDLRGALTIQTVQHRAAITDPKGVGALLRAIDDYDGQQTTKAALQLAPLVFVRPGELRQAEWAEINLDEAEWRIPAHKTKMRKVHRVPLSRQAIDILLDLQVLTGTGRFLFPSLRSRQRPMSENTLNGALRRLGYGKDEVTTHGFRATAAVRLNEMGRWNSDAIERQLAYQEASEVRRAYTHAAEFWKERCEMMQVWADYLDELRHGRKVVSLRSANSGT
jgi:integrase